MAYAPHQDGTIPFSTLRTNVTCKTYYKIFGDLTNGHPPLVVIHGGPGSGHEYCLPFSKLWSLYDVPVIFYDQIGCASSTHLRHTAGDQSFWQPEIFIEELENLLSHFHLYNSSGPGFDVLGHSWGVVIAAIFASRRPPGLRRLVLGSAVANGQLWLEGLWEVKKELSTESQSAIECAVKALDFENPAYINAMDECLKKFLCRADPWPPEELSIDMKNQAEDSTVRLAVQGRNPWIFDGVLGKLDLIPSLSQITAPTLVFNGEFDTTREGPTAPFFNEIPKVRWITLTQASHMAHLDSPAMQEKVLALIGNFLRSIRATGSAAL